jgi:serine/threonine protein kinase
MSHPSSQVETQRPTKPDMPVSAPALPKDDGQTAVFVERLTQIQSAPGQYFGKYELLGELGRGGMGVVYKARQADLDRIVAVKMMLSGSVSSDEEVQRFRTEAEAAARLQHAHIVKVYEVGEIDGRCFYSMEYIEGPSLAKRLASGPLPCRDAARYLTFIAHAVHHAHKNGILHRDLKPSNILLDAEGHPHVTDFGLAKKLDTDSGGTRTGAVMGTPSYMSPEQAAGRVRELSARSDVYSLGAVLYELLTGRPPFRSESAVDTILHVLERDPAPPRMLNPKVDRDLETICLKCLEKLPQHRYESAEALAVDLERYLKGDSIQARSFNVLDRIGRTLERDQHLAEFFTWGNLLLLFGVIILIEHVIVFFLTVGGPPYPRGWIMAARTAQFSLMGALFWRHRQHSLLPTSAAERQLWAIWIGYLVACMVVGAVKIQMLKLGLAPDELTMYPVWATLTGMAFFIMGSNYWGRCYAIGVGFFILSAVMPLALRWAALEFGVAWCISLTLIGLHLRRLARSAPASEENPPALTIDERGRNH